MPAAFLFLSVAIPFLYSSPVKGNISEESSSLIWDNLGHLGFVGISPRLLTSSWCATWLAVTRQGGLGAIESLEIFLLPVRSVDVIISSHILLFSAAILLISSLPVSRVVLSKRLLCTVSCMPHIDSLVLQIDQECSVSYTPLVYVTRMASTNLS